MMEIERVDLHNSCRSCLSSGNNLESIFECYYNDIPLSQILMGCFPLVIAESDGLSTKICEQCRLKVLSAHEFFQMFNNSEREIREWLKNESEVPEEEEPLIDDKASVDNSVTANNIEVLSFPSEKPDPKIERSPTKSLNHECEICSKKFPSPSKLSRHMRIHEKPYENTTKKFHCEICLKRFVCQAKVLRHMVIHDPDKSANFEIYEKTSQFTCKDCDKAFASRAYLISHEFLHSEEIVQSELPPESLGHFICIICLDFFDTSETLYDHTRKHYPGKQENMYECKLCAENKLNNKFSNLRAVIRHSKTHVENATHKCIFCEDVRMGYGEDFIEHMKNHLISNTCSVCDKTFATRSNLTKHKLSVHEGLKKHTCSICQAVFTQSTSLKAHYRIHEGNKPFSCEDCNAKFNSNMDLKRHRSRKHSLNLNVCEVPGCHLQFRFISSLEYHMQSHQEEDSSDLGDD